MMLGASDVEAIPPSAATFKAIEAIPATGVSHPGLDLGEAGFHIRPRGALASDEVGLNVFAQPPEVSEFVTG